MKYIILFSLYWIAVNIMSNVFYSEFSVQSFLIGATASFIPHITQIIAMERRHKKTINKTMSDLLKIKQMIGR